MGLRTWIAGLRKRDDQAALDRAAARSLESDAERRASDYETVTADERTAGMRGDTPGGVLGMAERDNE
jgi:hypothetical protein